MWILLEFEFKFSGSGRSLFPILEVKGTNSSSSMGSSTKTTTSLSSSSSIIGLLLLLLVLLVLLLELLWPLPFFSLPSPSFFLVYLSITEENSFLLSVNNIGWCCLVKVSLTWLLLILVFGLLLLLLFDLGKKSSSSDATMVSGFFVGDSAGWCKH